MDVRSTEELIAHGVSLFSAGDLAGAARAWLQGLEQSPGERRTVGYLKHLKRVAPEILSLAEEELSVRLEPHIKLSMPPIEVQSGERELFVGSKKRKIVAPIDPPRQPSPEPLQSQEPDVSVPAPTPPQAPYAGRGHFPDVEPSIERVSKASAPPVHAEAGSLRSASTNADLNEEIESLQQCLRADDLTGALAIAERLESLAPKHPMALAARQHCIPKLEAMWLSELGGEGGFLEVSVASHELLKSNLDALSGFLLSQVDGRTPVSQLLQLSGQPRFQSLEALYRLKAKGLVQVRL